jgi:hypothetical protein
LKSHKKKLRRIHEEKEVVYFFPCKETSEQKSKNTQVRGIGHIKSRRWNPFAHRKCIHKITTLYLLYNHECATEEIKHVFILPLGAKALNLKFMMMQNVLYAIIIFSAMKRFNYQITRPYNKRSEDESDDFPHNEWTDIHHSHHSFLESVT